jgi:predicted SprT family Zn-dependent metalloprotease
MKIADARYRCDQLIDTTFTINGKQYCARDLGYSFEWMNSKRTFGVCNYTKKLIKLSEHLCYHNQIEQVEDTILHELAHAFSYHIFGRAGIGHNHLWKSVCVQIGARPSRCYTDKEVNIGGYKYVLRHKVTKEEFTKYHKWPAKTHKKIKNIYIKRRKMETLGQLEIVAATECPSF